MNAMHAVRLDEALSSWRQWYPRLSARPQIVRRLAGGLTNISWLVDAGGVQLVVRLNSPFDFEFNIDRERELYILRAVADLGYAPAVYHADLEQGFLVSEFIEGCAWTDQDMQQESNQALLRNLMLAARQISLPFPKFDYWAHLCHYERCLDRRGIVIDSALRQRKHDNAQAIQAFQRADWAAVLTHHDLGVGNLIQRGDRLYILDWEYAAAGYGGMDFPNTPEQLAEAVVVAELSRLINDYWFLLKSRLAALS